MAKKPAKKAVKTMGKKDLKKTKGGILIGLNQPSAIKLTPSLGGIISPTDIKSIGSTAYKLT